MLRSKYKGDYSIAFEGTNFEANADVQLPVQRCE